MPAAHQASAPSWGARLRQAGALTAVLACVAVVGAACAGSPAASTASGDPGAHSPAGSSVVDGGSGGGTANAYTSCMRAHGVKKFPSPSSRGTFQYTPGSGLDPSSPQFQAASKACAGLIPSSVSGGPPTSARLQFAKYANCMRSHGISGFPGGSSGGSVQVQMPASINPFSPKFQAAQAACQSLMPGGGPGFGP